MLGPLGALDVTCVLDQIQQVDAPNVERDWEPRIPQKKFYTATSVLGPSGALGVACVLDCILRVNEPNVERDWEPRIP